MDSKPLTRMDGAAVADEIVKALLAKGAPYYAPQLLLDSNHDITYPVATWWNEETQQIYMVACCDDAARLWAAHAYAKQVASESPWGAWVWAAWWRGQTSMELVEGTGVLDSDPGQIPLDSENV